MDVEKITFLDFLARASLALLVTVIQQRKKKKKTKRCKHSHRQLEKEVNVIRNRITVSVSNSS